MAQKWLEIEKIKWNDGSRVLSFESLKKYLLTDRVCRILVVDCHDGTYMIVDGHYPFAIESELGHRLINVEVVND